MARVYPDSTAADAALAGAQSELTRNEFVAPYLFEVRDQNGRIVPVKEREIIRAAVSHRASPYRQAGGVMNVMVPPVEPNMYRYDEFDVRFVSERVEQFAFQVERRLKGELTEDQFKPLRLMNGLYLQLHAYMLRVAVPYGTLSSRQVRKLAHIARTYDKNFGHFTTRQNIQYNWIKLVDVPAILRELADVEMHAIQTSGNCIRNVTADHFAGAAADEIEDRARWPRSCASGRACIRNSSSCRASSRLRSAAHPMTAQHWPITTWRWRSCAMRRGAPATRCWWAAAWGAPPISPR